MTTKIAQREWRLHRGNGTSDSTLRGDTLAQAIENNIAQLHHASSLGNAAGYILLGVYAQYVDGILGGKGGVEITVDHAGSRLANERFNMQPRSVQANTYWLYAEKDDCPEPIEIYRRQSGFVKPNGPHQGTVELNYRGARVFID